MIKKLYSQQIVGEALPSRNESIITKDNGRGKPLPYYKFLFFDSLLGASPRTGSQ